MVIKTLIWGQLKLQTKNEHKKKKLNISLNDCQKSLW